MNEPNTGMVESTIAKPLVARLVVNIMYEGGAGMQFSSPFTKEEFLNELIKEGGISRTGYAAIPSVPKGLLIKSEYAYIYRQKVIGFLLDEIAETNSNKITIPTLHAPIDIIGKKS